MLLIRVFFNFSDYESGHIYLVHASIYIQDNKKNYDILEYLPTMKNLYNYGQNLTVALQSTEKYINDYTQRLNYCKNIQKTLEKHRIQNT